MVNMTYYGRDQDTKEHISLKSFCFLTTLLIYWLNQQEEILESKINLTFYGDICIRLPYMWYEYVSSSYRSVNSSLPRDLLCHIETTVDWVTGC